MEPSMECVNIAVGKDEPNRYDIKKVWLGARRRTACSSADLPARLAASATV
jgi:hypothetical protein